MPEFSVDDLPDFGISEDGRTAVLNFTGPDQISVSLKIDTLILQRMSHQIGSVLTQSRRLSNRSRDVVPIVRPTRFRADLTTDNTLVGIQFVMNSGIEHTYGLEANDAEALARQISDAAQRGRRTSAPSRH
jgi:hypothetical protein